MDYAESSKKLKKALKDIKDEKRNQNLYRDTRSGNPSYFKQKERR